MKYQLDDSLYVYYRIYNPVRLYENKLLKEILFIDDIDIKPNNEIASITFKVY